MGAVSRLSHGTVKVALAHVFAENGRHDIHTTREIAFLSFLSSLEMFVVHTEG